VLEACERVIEALLPAVQLAMVAEHVGVGVAVAEPAEGVAASLQRAFGVVEVALIATDRPQVQQRLRLAVVVGDLPADPQASFILSTDLATLSATFDERCFPRFDALLMKP
jgi:hypothetical protein